ncbi:hypothetical protein MTBPR1_30253 [Candidatus Terasakiella magnetica]|uniref:Uncharacterized protein n=1 Tax=Candidatus Terasakiella magnetica TaxID=1867952 RepID=A0A1C3RHX8_9PROT|nr:hypothetical protein [Candidatus Terasakiella magnetica]SCA56883.1 hypothetical protein MTBPR1_30253 [Candidatus Terasakiella magnetica]
MSGTATIAITVGVAVAVLVGFFIVYYLGNVANSIYDIKVGVRKDFESKVKELQEWIDNDTKQRINWMRDENKEEGKRFKESMEGHLEETFMEMEKTIERLRADVNSLQMQVNNLQDGKGVKVKVSDAPPMNRPKAEKEPMGIGDVELARTGMPEAEEAPDMAAPVKKEADEGKDAIKDKPTPPPPPKSSNQPAGRASVEEKAKKKKKKRRNPDAFESFDSFSEDFKSGR